MIHLLLMWGEKGRRWSLLRLQPLQIPAFCLWNIFPHVIFKPNCIALITEFLMWPDEGSSYLLHFGTPALTIPSPDRLLCTYCCQQDCFPFGFLMNISIQSIFCIFIGRPQTCGLSSPDIGSICGSQRGVQAAAASHATPSTHGCPCSRSHPIPIPCFTGLSIPSRLCPAHPAAAPDPPFHTPAATALQWVSPCFPSWIYLSSTWWPLLPSNPKCVWPHWHPQWGWSPLGMFSHWGKSKIHKIQNPTKIHRDFVKLWGWCCPSASPLGSCGKGITKGWRWCPRAPTFSTVWMNSPRLFPWP